MPAAQPQRGKGSPPHLELALACVGGTTRLVRCASRAPLRVFRPVLPTRTGGAGADGAGRLGTGDARPDGLVEVPLVHLGGGLLPGECVDAVVRVGAGAAACFTSVGATHLYPPPAPGAAPAELRVALEVEPGAVVEWVPEPLVPHAGARYRQRTTVLLHAGASLFYADCLVAGRSEEEAFSWDELALRVEVMAPGGTLLAVDALRLAPRRRAGERLRPSPLPDPLPAPGCFGRHRALASVLMVAESALLDRLIFALADLLHGLPTRCDADGKALSGTPVFDRTARVHLLGGVSRLPGGVGLSVRLFAPGGGAAVAAGRAILACWHRAWQQTGREPPCAPSPSPSRP